MRRLLLAFAAIVLTFAITAIATASTADVDIQTWPLQTLMQNSMGADEQIPEGVPGGYDWYDKAVVHYVAPSTAYPYANPWGVVYNARTGNTASLDRVEVTGLQEWTLSASTDQWTALYSSPPTLGGALFPEAFNGASICGRYAFDGTGGILMTPNVACGGTRVSGYTWHFYPATSRALVSNPSDVAAVAVMARVRLDPSIPATDDPSYVVAVGSDFWTSPTGSTFHGSGQSRMITVTRDWRTVVYTTVPAAQIAATPLPPVSVDPNELH